MLTKVDWSKQSQSLEWSVALSHVEAVGSYLRGGQSHVLGQPVVLGAEGTSRVSGVQLPQQVHSNLPS